MELLTTVDAVINAVGGTSAAARLTKRKPQHVSNWRYEKRIAAETFLIFMDELEKLKLTAPAKLWGITDPVKRKAKPRAA